MKKSILFSLLFLLLAPAAAQAYSFQTPEYQELRSLVNNLEDNEYTPARQDEKEAWLQELVGAAEGASASLIRVRDEERARLAGIYSARVTKINNAANKSLAARKKGISKWCARKKQGKTAKQQAAIEKTCEKKRGQAEASAEKYKSEKIADVERDYGKTSSRYKSLDRNYARFEENRQEFLERGQAAITAMPFEVPTSLSPPVITGTAAVGETLSASTGQWDSSPVATYSYQWQRCNSGGTGCVNLAGATFATYQIVPEDATKSLRVVVTATNAGGSTSQASALTAAVAT